MLLINPATWRSASKCTFLTLTLNDVVVEKETSQRHTVDQIKYKYRVRGSLLRIVDANLYFLNLPNNLEFFSEFLVILECHCIYFISGWWKAEVGIEVSGLPCLDHCNISITLNPQFHGSDLFKPLAHFLVVHQTNISRKACNTDHPPSRLTKNARRKYVLNISNAHFFFVF